jgi:hypothetical protein
VINFFLRAVSGDAEIEFYQIVEESVRKERSFIASYQHQDIP